jgi:hypothetical protein
MKRFASTRSEKRASQPWAGFAQWSVVSIEDDGIRYGFTTQALIASTIAIAPAMVTIQSIVIRSPCGRPRVSRSTGFRESRSGSAGRGWGSPLGTVAGSGSSARRPIHAAATASPIQSRSKSPRMSCRASRKRRSISPDSSPTSGKTSRASNAKPRYLPITIPSSAVATATTWSSGPRRPPVAAWTAKAASRPTASATMPAS